MSSTNKTSLGLNMWEASDKPVRQDFVNDNAIINEKITKLNSDLIPQAYQSTESQIIMSSLLDPGWAVLIKVGRLCTLYGSFVVKEGIQITSIDLFNIRPTGIVPLETTFPVTSISGEGAIGTLKPDGRVIFAIVTPGTVDWRFNFSFLSAK